MSAVLVYVTASNAKEADGIARQVVTERLAACANILGAIRSLYWWQGKIQEEDEVSFILKTERALVERLTKRIKELHTYTVPCVVALAIDGGNSEFLRWIAEETEKASGR